MLHSFTFWLSVVAVLIAYLGFSVGRRWWADTLRRQARERQSSGTAFDASAIAPQLQRVRQDHLAVIKSRPQQLSYRAGLLAMARRMVASLPYFRHAGHEHGIQNDGG